MNHLEKAKALRNETSVHYNCCQSVLIPFAAELGLSEEQLCRLGTHFGAGMRHGSTCGTLTGALLVLGELGYDEAQAGAVLREFRQKHGCTDCAHLLSAAKERGQARKDHCDGLVLEMVSALEALAANKPE